MSDAPGSVVIVTGPPGSGKTTVSRSLAATGPKAVHLESDHFFHYIASGFEPPHLPEAHQQNTAVMSAVSLTAREFALAGFTVFWDGIVGPWFLDQATAPLFAAGIEVSYVVLRTSRDEALQRVRDRDGTVETSGAETMWDQLADLGPLESHVIHIDDGADGQDVLEATQAVLAGDDARLKPVPVGTPQPWAVSVKGRLRWRNGDGVDEFVVLQNERNEWELPGGRLESTDEDPESALRREFGEELGLEIVVGPLLDSWLYDVAGRRVLILTYDVEAHRPDQLWHSAEHAAVALRSRADLASAAAGTSPDGVGMPKGYLRCLDMRATLSAD